MIVWSDRLFHTRYYTPAFPVSGSYSSLLSTHNVTEQRGPSTTGLSLYHWLSAPLTVMQPISSLTYRTILDAYYEAAEKFVQENADENSRLHKAQ